MLSSVSMTSLKIKYNTLGHVITKEGISVDPGKIKTIENGQSKRMWLTCGHSWGSPVTIEDSLQDSQESQIS